MLHCMLNALVQDRPLQTTRKSKVKGEGTLSGARHTSTTKAKRGYRFLDVKTKREVCGLAVCVVGDHFLVR